MMIELKLLGGKQILVNPDRVIIATYYEQSETCELWMVEYNHPLRVEHTIDELKKLLNRENN